MNDKNNPKLTPNSQTLRTNMTDEEKHLWYDFLQKLPVQFNRQKVIGNYIVDFYCAKAKLVIELDGKQHYSENGISADRERDAHLRSLGIEVVRYTNVDIHDRFKGVCNDILRKIGLNDPEFRM